MIPKPVSLSEALASFDEIYSPRIVGRVNDYDVGIAHASGEHVWHVHDDTDEFFLVLDGRFDIALREGGGREQTVTLHQGDVFIVPRGTEHKPSSPAARSSCSSRRSPPPRVTGMRVTSPITWTAPPATNSTAAPAANGA